ncbi:MAG: ArsR family transcriptional regulator [bacterium]
MATVQLMVAPFILPNLSDNVLLAKFFRALGDPTRLRILEAVTDEEKNVSQLVEITGSLQGRVSSHPLDGEGHRTSRSVICCGRAGLGHRHHLQRAS